jgi:phenol 2-monooxygenase
MNVSIMDGFNLSWKLVHSLFGLTPTTTDSGDKVLDTFQIERLTVAQQLIAFDKEFSTMFSGKIGVGDGQESLTHEQFLEVFSTGNGFTSGCGIEYPENLLVEKTTSENLINGTDYLSGILRPGRRLLNVKVKRHADGVRRDLQDGKNSFSRPK